MTDLKPLSQEEWERLGNYIHECSNTENKGDYERTHRSHR